MDILSVSIDISEFPGRYFYPGIMDFNFFNLPEQKYISSKKIYKKKINKKQKNKHRL